MNERLTLQSVNKKLENYQNDTNDKLNKILELLKSSEKKCGNSNGANYRELNIENFESDCENAKGFYVLMKEKSEEIIDEYENVFVKLPTIWVKLENTQLKFYFEEKESFKKLQPQLVSKYKNSLDNGMIRSIPNVAPNFNQLSYNKSTKFCKWVDGEQLNWQTVLYLQIMWLYIYNTKENNRNIPNEDYKWNEERDCGWQDTGLQIGEFLGIEQLFTSGYNYFSFENYKGKKELLDIFKNINNMHESTYDNVFGYIGDCNRDKDSSCFFSCALFNNFFISRFNFDSPRLCKKPF